MCVSMNRCFAAVAAAALILGPAQGRVLGIPIKMRPLPGSGLSIDKAIEEEAPFAAVCEAVGRLSVSSTPVAPGGAASGRQEFKVVEVLFGRAKPVDRIDIAYRLTGRPIGSHERVIWIGHTRNMKSHGSLYGLKALPDTSQNRQAVTAAAARARPVAPKATPGRLAEDRAKQLKADIESFHLDLGYYGEISEGREGPSNRLILHVNPTTRQLPWPSVLRAVQITKEQAEKTVDHLATEGFLKGAKNGSDTGTISYRRPGYVLWVNTKRLKLYESLGWDLKMLRRVQGLRKVLEGDAAKAMDELLATLEPQRKLWEPDNATSSEPTVEASGVKPDDQTPAGESAWGEAVEGVQVRLRAKQSKWNEGEVPHLTADVRNQGKRTLFVTTQPNRCGLEVDGQWYRPTRRRGVLLRPKLLPPGHQYSIGVSLHRYWELPASRIARAPWQSGRLELTPGKHTIRVAFTATDAQDPPGKPFKAVSNPVVIEIVAKSDEKADATPQDNAGATSAEPTAEATGVKPDEQAPAGEAAWGQPVEGVQVRLRAKQLKWNEGTVPRLSADVRNQGKRNLSVQVQSHRWELEVDGRRYRGPRRGGVALRPKPLPPGRQYDNILVQLHGSWGLAASRIARSPWESGRLKLTPGKHTIRVAVTASVKVVSNPVEIEIVAKSDKEADATQQAKASATSAVPPIEATDAKPDDPTTAVRPVKPSPEGGKTDVDKDLEKEAVFDMEEVVPASEPKLRDVIGNTFNAAVARKGEIEIGGRQYTALMAHLGGTTGNFDQPGTLLLLTSADNPKHRIQDYEMHLGSIRTVNGKYYKVSATPTGDKLTVTPCGDNVGVLRVGAGDRDVEKREVTGGILVSKETVVPLGNAYYPVPAEDPGQRRIPLGDYALRILFVNFGNVNLSLRPNGPRAYNINIRKDKPFTLNFAAKGNLLLTSPRPTQTFKPGSSVPLVARIVDPELNLHVRTWEVDPTVVIRDSSGKQVAEGKLPGC